MFLIMCVSAVKEGVMWKLTVTKKPPKKQKNDLLVINLQQNLGFFLKPVCVLETVKMKH